MELPDEEESRPTSDPIDPKKREAILEEHVESKDFLEVILLLGKKIPPPP